MVTFSVGLANPSAKLDLGQMPSSHGELTVQLETRTLRQQSMSMPSRSVSILRLSMVRLSTPVSSMPKWPPLRMEKSRSDDVAAVLEGDRLVADAGLLGA